MDATIQAYNKFADSHNERTQSYKELREEIKCLHKNCPVDTTSVIELITNEVNMIETPERKSKLKAALRTISQTVHETMNANFKKETLKWVAIICTFTATLIAVIDCAGKKIYTQNNSLKAEKNIDGNNPTSK